MNHFEIMLPPRSWCSSLITDERGGGLRARTRNEGGERERLVMRFLLRGMEQLHYRGGCRQAGSENYYYNNNAQHPPLDDLLT